MSQLFGRDLNTVLHVLMHHAQLGRRLLLHNKVNCFFGRDFEKLQNNSSGPDSEFVGTHPPTAEDRSDYIAVDSN
jgi:hypothetical protein